MPSRALEKTVRRAGVAPWLLGLLAVLQGVAAPAQGLFVDGRVPFFIARPTTELSLAVERDESSIETPASKREAERLERRLRFDVSTHGFVYHPALVTYRLRLRPEYRWQDNEQAQGSKSGSRQQFLGYAIDTTWLKEKTYNLTLSARQDRSEASSPLASQTTNESRVFSAGLRRNSWTLPVNISFNKSDSESGGFLPARTSNEFWRMTAKYVKGESETSLGFDLGEYERQLASALSTVEHLSLQLQNSYTPRDKLKLGTSATYSETARADQVSRSYQLGSHLQLQHRDNLRSSYSAAFNASERQGFSSHSATYSAGLSHLLYENLTTSLNVNGASSESDAGKSVNYAGRISLGYTRRIPWGQITLSHSEGRGVRDDQRDATFLRVENAAFVFEGVSASIVLEDVSIDADSIVVTDAEGLVVYVPGIDYDIDSAGVTTTITRNTLGGIGDDETVLVSYSFIANPPAKNETSVRSSGLHLDLWDHVGLFYNESRNDERFIEGIPPEFPLDSRSKSAGASITLGPSTTTFRLSELESARAPRKTKRISELLRFMPGGRTSLSLGVDYAETELTDTGELTESHGARATVTWGLERLGRLSISASARRSESGLRKQDNKSLTVDYRWSFGAWRSSLHLVFGDTANEFVETTWSRRTIRFETRRVFR